MLHNTLVSIRKHPTQLFAELIIEEFEEKKKFITFITLNKWNAKELSMLNMACICGIFYRCVNILSPASSSAIFLIFQTQTNADTLSKTKQRDGLNV